MANSFGVEWPLILRSFGSGRTGSAVEQVKPKKIALQTLSTGSPLDADVSPPADTGLAMLLPMAPWPGGLALSF